jgi:DNA-binding response OmpR family regulator
MAQDHRDDDGGRGDPSGPILVADDDPHLRETLAEILEREGHVVLQAGDGPTAARLKREHSPDLLVLDDTLAGLSPELRRELGAETTSVVKPFNVADVLTAVQRHLRRVKRDAS